MFTRTELRMLCRAPWRTGLFALLLAAAVAAACLGGGLLAASGEGMTGLSERYTTIAVIKTTDNQYGEEFGQLKMLAEQTEHGRLDSRKIYGGYIPGVRTMTSLQETLELELNSQVVYWPDSKVRKRTGQQSKFDDEYSNAALIATCVDKIPQEIEPGMDASVQSGYFSLHVEEVLSVHESYRVPEFVMAYYYKDAFSDLMPTYEIGKRYFITGLINFPDYIESDFPVQISGIYQSTKETASHAGCYEMTGTLEEALEGEDGEEIARLMRGCEIALNSITVIATERINGILPFNKGDLYITEGRAFTVQEAAAGAPVCVMSEKLAQMNGLSVGDTISIELYEAYAGVYQNDRGRYEWCRSNTSVFDSALEEAQELEIIGLFNTPAWDFQAKTQTLSPNTAIIPAKHVEDADKIYWPASLYTILIENGHAEDFLAEMEAQKPGSSEKFVVYDQGYSEVLPTMEAFAENARLVAAGCAAVFALAAGVFLALAAARNRHDLGVMRSLGVQKRAACGAFVLRCAAPALLGSVLGCCAGQLLFARAVSLLGAEGLAVRPVGVQWAVAGGCAALVLLAAVATGAALMKKKPQELMREGRG